MSFKSRFMRLTFCFTLLFQLSGMVLPGLVPKAHALFWEDDTDSNDPKERKRRPDHFSLFDWAKDADKDTKERDYRELENRDHGPSVNNDARTLELVSSGVIGLALGLVVADRVTTNNSDYTVNMFIGGALGFGFGVGFGALIMPNNYEVDPLAQAPLPAQRLAALKTLPPELTVSFKF